MSKETRLAKREEKRLIKEAKKNKKTVAVEQPKKAESSKNINNKLSSF